ncbi:MAG TPA: cob(I)yrinic acid a,c-diamide adenosyltransferase, partial [Limnochorda sp.]
LGLIRAELAGASRFEAERSEWDAFLGKIQAWLFQAGAVLAAPDPERAKVEPFPEEPTQELERAIDALDSGLPPLKAFILPGGSRLAAQVHVARTVARRAERAVVALHAEEPVPGPILAFLNRLSDYLFVLARTANVALGSDEIMWRPGP